MRAILATIDDVTQPAEVDFTVAYSGGKLSLPDWELPVVIDLSPYCSITTARAE